MAEHTKIEWADATANVVNGCSLSTPGCTNCYAMRLAGTRLRNHPSRKGLTTQTKAGPVWNGEVRFNERALQDVLRWRQPRMIFWNAHGDLFHESVPDAWIDRCFAAMALTPHHIHQVLTKRSARMREYLDRKSSGGGAGAVADQMAALGAGPGAQLTFMELIAEYSCLPNVWLGVSVEDQKRADERVPDLLATPAAVRWLSCEPLLGAVNLLSVPAHGWCFSGGGRASALRLDGRGLDWIVVGGESGPGARGSTDDVEANMRSLLAQCRAASVPFFGKQNFRKLPLPHDLMVREMPEVRHG